MLVFGLRGLGEGGRNSNFPDSLSPAGLLGFNLEEALKAKGGVGVEV